MLQQTNRISLTTPSTDEAQHPSQRTAPLLISALCGGLLFLAPQSGFSEPTQFDQVQTKRTLTVFSVAGDSTFFGKDAFMHGFGYDLARAYAEDLNVRLDFHKVSTNAAALDAVQKGKADIALTTADSTQLEKRTLSSVMVSCGNPVNLSKYGLNPALNLAFRDAADPLASSANGFLCSGPQAISVGKMAAFYDQTFAKSPIFKASFNKAINARLPMYKTTFQLNAKQLKMDWHLLAAVSYQESQLIPTAVSPTGVTGLMMLTQGTASDMGVTNRQDPVESIRGGSQYLKQMLNQYAGIPNPDRLWYALAAYNMGPGTVDRVRAAIRKQGKNPNEWVNFYQYISDNKARSSQYGQCMDYVTRIRAYLETLKQDGKLARI